MMLNAEKCQCGGFSRQTLFATRTKKMQFVKGTLTNIAPMMESQRSTRGALTASDIGGESES